MNHPLLTELTEALNKDLEHFLDVLARTRTGRASPSLISHIKVECYGTKSPIDQVAKLSSESHDSLLVNPWDPQNTDAIEAAIRNSNLGLNPARAGASIRIPVPPLTGERREALVKHISAEAENCRVTIRNHRRDVIHKIKSLAKENEMSEDESKGLEKQVESITQNFVGKTNAALAEKTAELSQV